MATRKKKRKLTREQERDAAIDRLGIRLFNLTNRVEKVEKETVVQLNRVVTCEANGRGIRSDLELQTTRVDALAGWRMRLDAEARGIYAPGKFAGEGPDVSGFAVPPIGKGKSDFAMSAWRESTALFLLTPDEYVSNAGLLDFLKVYAGDQTKTGKAIFAMAHELLSLKVK